jgi:putative SOS response-associated peptidase YedK
MCGRYTLTPKAIDMLPGLFGIDPTAMPDLGPGSYNVAPTTQRGVVRADLEGHRRMDILRWGLVPFWAKDPKKGPPLINARADTVAEKPSFRAAFRARRCLVPADGFFEWRGVPHNGSLFDGLEQAEAPKTAKSKQPVYFQLADRRPFAFAGLWERWQGPEGELESFTLITTQPNELVAPVHDRMPVILPEEAYALWLDPRQQDISKLMPLLAPYPADAMIATFVNAAVNSVRNDDPGCIAPVD